MTVTKEGRRYYISGNTYPIRSQLRAAGCNWDGGRKAWWTGKKEVAERFAATEVTKTGGDTPSDDTRLKGRVRYKNRSYYVIAESRDAKRLRLTTLDAKLCFWADSSACEWLKRYSPREVRVGYGRHTRTEYTTIGSMRRFIASRKHHDPEGVGRDLPEGYYMHEGEVLAVGCSECQRLGRMCPSCYHDYL